MHEPTFGRYTLLERIDVGGMAEVFRALSRGAAGFERIVAIKRILPHIALDTDIVRMFVEEAKLAVQLGHPNIAQVFDLGEVDGHYFIAMEYVDGHSLKTLFDRAATHGERLPTAAVCFVVAEVADALHHAHFAQDAFGTPLDLIHRDISPQNILLSFGGEVKVIDFGLAKVTGRAHETQDGVVKGKLAYLSPEQAHGRPIDKRTDIFSLGVCAWEAFTGRRAFKRGDDRETVLAIRRGEIEPPSRHVDLPAAIERVVMRALAVDADARYGTARELRDELVAVVKREGLTFDRTALAAMMRTTFPERFVDEPVPADGAFSLVQRKTGRPPAEPAPYVPPVWTDPGPDTFSEPGSLGSLSDDDLSLDEPPDLDDRTDPRLSDDLPGEDTLPGVVLPLETD